MSASTPRLPVGTVLLLSHELPAPCEWVVIETSEHGARMMATDGHTLIGSKDMGIPASSTHDRMAVRGNTEVTVPWALLSDAIETQVLPKVWVDRLRANEGNPSAEATQTDSDVDYKTWCDDLQQSVLIVCSLAERHGIPKVSNIVPLRPATSGSRRLGWPAAAAGLIAAGALALIVTQITTEGPSHQIKGTAKVHGTAQQAGSQIVIEAVTSHAGRLSLFSASRGQSALRLAQSDLKSGGRYVLHGTALPFTWVPRHDPRPHSSLVSTSTAPQTLAFVLESTPLSGRVLTLPELLALISRSADQEYFQHEYEAGLQVIVHRIRIGGRIDAP